MIDAGPFRLRAREFCERATRGSQGVTIADAVYREVTEGRDPGPGYSSCGDLAHAMLYALGVRLPWINRAEFEGWKPGLNVARLARRPIGSSRDGCARLPLPGEQFQTGDTIILWKEGGNTQDAHVCVVEATILGPAGTATLSTWDYGQAPMSREAWAVRRDYVEGCSRSRNVHLTSSGLWLARDGRSVQSVLPLTDVLEYAAAHGALEAA